MLTRKALLVIDCSIEQVDIGPGNEKMIANIRRLAKSGKFDGLFDCRLSIDDPSRTSLTRVYPTVGLKSSKGSALLKSLMDLDLHFVAKYNYSSFFDTQLDSKLKSFGVTDVYLTGVNTEFCIFATCLDAFYRMYNVHGMCL